MAGRRLTLTTMKITLFSKKEELVFPKREVPYTNLGSSDLGNMNAKRTKRLALPSRLDNWLVMNMRYVSIIIFFGLILGLSIHSISLRP